MAEANGTDRDACRRMRARARRVSAGDAVMKELGLPANEAAQIAATVLLPLTLPLAADA